MIYRKEDHEQPLTVFTFNQIIGYIETSINKGILYIKAIIRKEKKMIYRRKTYRIRPNRLEDFNQFFHSYLYPNQLKHGANLVGRWVNESKDEIVAIWKYESMEQYETIESMIKKSELHQKAKERRLELGELFIESRQDFLTSTAEPNHNPPPKHIVSVSGYITNEKGEVLLVRNQHRSDTMEMPGGQVEEGETLEEAIHREIFEETGAKVRLTGITGIYQNITNNIICVVFRGEYQSGELRTAEGETTEVIFTPLTKENVEQFITRPHFKNRAIDAMVPSYLPYEAFRVGPYELIKRYDVKKED